MSDATRVHLEGSDLGCLSRLAAERFGAKPALLTAERELSYREVEQLVATLAASLAQLGIGAGHRVVLHLPNGWRWIVAYYAIARLGAVIVPTNILLTTAEVVAILQDSSASALIAPTNRLSAAELRLRKLPSMAFIGDEVAAGCTTIDGLLTAADSNDSGLELSRARTDDIAMICYTSGTTGRSKGAVLTHRAVTANAALTADMHGRSASDRIVTGLPCAHIYGTLIVNMTFQCGGTLMLLTKFDPDIVLDSIARRRATIIDGVPTMYYYLLDSPKLDGCDLSSLRLCTVGGQAMTLPRMIEAQRRLGCPLIEVWGMTELAGAGTTHWHGSPGRLGSIGVPLPHLECRIASVEDPARTAAPNEPGELFIRGPVVMREYWQQPQATREVLDEQGWLATGDIGYRDADGYFFIVDRKKEMIITAGYNIYPSEIERVIATHPGVAMVGVGAVADPIKGEIAVAYIVPRDGIDCTEEAIVDLCRAQLAAYKIPRSVRFVATLPKTNSGKIMRLKLAEHS